MALQREADLRKNLIKLQIMQLGKISLHQRLMNELIANSSYAVLHGKINSLYVFLSNQNELSFTLS